MKTLDTLTLAALLSTAAPTAVLASPAVDTTRTCSSATTADIESHFVSFNEAWATLDPDAVTALFTAEPVLLPTLSNLPRTTPALMRDYFVNFLKLKPIGRIDTSTTQVDCQTASRVGTWTVAITNPATGQSSDVAARYSFIYRFENGVWKIDHLHSSAMPEPSSAPAH